MPFIEVKSTTSSGQTFKSKAALKRAITEDPTKVVFDSVSPMGGQFYGTAAEFLANGPENTKLTLVGPDPFTQRNWYGTAEVKNGQLKIS